MRNRGQWSRFFRSHPLLVRVYFTLHRTYDNPKPIESCAAGWQLLLLFTNLKGRAFAKAHS